MASSVTFYLRPNSKSNAGMPEKRFKPEHQLVTQCLVPDARKGNEGQYTWIRYKLGETSIYVDKQKSPFDPDDPSKGKNSARIKTDENGAIKVATNSPILLQYLRECVHNEPVAKIMGYGGRTITEYIPTQRENQQASSWTEDNKLRVELSNLDVLKLKAVYRVMSKRSSSDIELMPVDTIQHNIYAIAKPDPTLFYNLVRSELVMAQYAILLGIDRGILRQDVTRENELWWNAGNIHIVTAPLGKDYIAYFAQYLNDQQHATLVALQKQVGLDQTNLATKENLEITNNAKITIGEILNFVASNKEVGKTLFGKGKTQMHKTFVIDEGEPVELGTSNKAIIKKVEEDEWLLNKIRERFHEVTQPK